MRSVAPERPGSAASQKSWPVSSRKPTSGSRTTTTLQTIHTENARKSAKIEIHRLRRAIGSPLRAHAAASSGSHTESTCGSSARERSTAPAGFGRSTPAGARDQIVRPRTPPTKRSGNATTCASRENGMSAMRTNASTAWSFTAVGSTAAWAGSGEKVASERSHGTAVCRYQTDPQRSESVT